MMSAMDGVSLPPDLELFAAEAIAAGRYRDVGEVLAAGVDLLRRRETARAAFIASLEAAQREGEQNGFHEIEDVLAELDEIIAEEVRAKA
jgi:putative addiction module CopG family antidote